MNTTTFANAHYAELMRFLHELAVIPAPSHHEDARAAACLSWLRDHVPNAVCFIDDAKNVICEIGDTANKPIVLMMAHTDIVFDETVPLAVTNRNGKLFCPGIGDDTVHVAQVLLCAQYAAEHITSDSDVAFVFAANSCEEGQGDLKGCKALMARYGARLREVITFDGYLDVINDRAVGSCRYRIEVDVTGGHSFRDFGNNNAIALLCDIVTELKAIPLPKEHITTFNFGHIAGGTTVNSIASHAQLLYEFRADHVDNLRYMQQAFGVVIDRFRDRCRLTVTSIGERPCASGVDETALEALFARAEQALDGVSQKSRYPTSTDANIPLSMGIPAVCLGFVRGGGAHTTDEYIDENSIFDGFEAALRFTTSYL
ncbi:MAG: M20/M25/M40 family metallo-hydrolase [Clostridia bacterium]|nr:M20/M25/M40 family metallo-hydrolase [Clostridia bacterium]